ncbi:hypothetical protein DSL64_02685 [Dyadobacter luteus]|uniref:Uncharacterized protein n=1 Tax=Dyadobacter luteus TaxID=2259619 RepID=A0A3D8YI10_9BACT|nr:hypothetical protein [Dyadobacter luteus]REA64473.1 hypothetical protein DSL64_02685 [Dyadobacter luteus]
MLKRLLLLAALLIVRYHAGTHRDSDDGNESSFSKGLVGLNSAGHNISGLCPLVQRVYLVFAVKPQEQDLKSTTATDPTESMDRLVLEKRTKELEKENQQLRARLNELNGKDSDAGDPVQQDTGIYGPQAMRIR